MPRRQGLILPPRRVALFLRGINVAGIKVPMAELRHCLAELGFGDVRTWLQSGNVALVTELPAAELRPLVEKALTERFGYDAHVVVLDHARLATIVNGYPFQQRATHHRYAVLCDSGDVLAELAGLEPGPDEEAAPGDGVLYWSCPKGSSLDTPLAKALSRRAFKTSTTTRNLNTLEKML